jgi:hypothetical protein
LAKHYELHRFAIAKDEDGIAKMLLFNPGARTFVQQFIADNKK